MSPELTNGQLSMQREINGAALCVDTFGDPILDRRKTCRRCPTICVRCSVATGSAVPGARLLVIEELGHEFPRSAWDDVLPALIAVTAGLRQAGQDTTRRATLDRSGVEAGSEA